MLVMDERRMLKQITLIFETGIDYDIKVISQETGDDIDFDIVEEEEVPAV